MDTQSPNNILFHIAIGIIVFIMVVAGFFIGLASYKRSKTERKGKT